MSNPGPRSRARLALAACALALAAAAPATAQAQVAEATTPSTTTAPPEERLRVYYGSTHVLAYAVKRVRGTLSTGQDGRLVLLRRYSRGEWTTVARTRTRDGGRFALRYRPRSLGAHRLHTRLAKERPASGASTASRPARRLTAYRRTHASYYGPGLYGNRLACGGRLYRSTRGVAHKSLPCGTKVTFRYRGRAVTVRVIDRGPYIRGRTWDLTAPVRNELRFPPTGSIWSNR